MRVVQPVWPSASWMLVSFLGGCSFTGFYFLPMWLMWPLFFLTPVAGPVLLLAAGVLAMSRVRGLPGGPSLRMGRLVAFAAALALIPVAVFDLFLLGVVPYIGLIIALIAFPFHYACVVVFAAGVAAVLQAGGTSVRARRLVPPAVAGLLAGIALVGFRFWIVPRSSGVFLKAFAASGSQIHPGNAPLDPHGQKDIAETSGVHPRSLHEPIAALGEDSLWTVSRSHDAVCSGYWIQRRGFQAGATDWRTCLEAASGVTRNPTGMTADSSAGVLVVGFDVHSSRMESWWLKRFDAQGREDMSWDKAFPAETKIDRVYGVLVDRNGAAYVLGEAGEIDRRGTFGWVRKFDRDGREVLDGWPKRFDNAGERRPTMAAIGAATDAAGHLYVLLDLYGGLSIRKFDSDGSEIPGWEKDLPQSKDITIAADPAGSLLVAGVIAYPDQAWLAKFNPDGSTAWEKRFALGHLSATLAVASDQTGNVYAAGYGTGPDEKSSYWWIKKFGPDGLEIHVPDQALSEPLSGPGPGNIPFALRINDRNEIYVVGAGSGWRFSGSWLERWWGW